ncbi:GGDEF domain-containing protein [Eubacterium ruminantium]|uniref:GGDEF domain-containing protein n=1 Tax=Eubacterium ruminantium TaxID=42322 RepID=UPI00247AA84F|nr:GGDEF domain-containing protein [Eubacterium ruminantium]
MSDYFLYYSSINVVGAITFGIMFLHDKFSIDRQEKQLKYDHALLAYISYFLLDAIWVGMDSRLFPFNETFVIAIDLALFIAMTAITYMWLRFVMAYEQVGNRNKLSMRIKLIMPLICSTIILIIAYIIDPALFIDEDYKTTGIYDIFLVCIPCLYIAAVIVYTMRMAVKESSRSKRQKHLFIGLFPIMVVVGGLIQMLLIPRLPIYCFSSTILMIIFYIQSMEARISTDPLTLLNNRGQLERYISQENNLRIEGRKNYVLMIDVNDFKIINDNYGHAEGDSALVIVSKSLIRGVEKMGIPTFIGRYGGDEFIMITHPYSFEDVKMMIAIIREDIRNSCRVLSKPYLISIGVGCDELLDPPDTFVQCQERADEKLYDNKKHLKDTGKSTKIR